MRQNARDVQTHKPFLPPVLQASQPLITLTLLITVMENLHVTFFFMHLGLVYYSVYGLAILLSFRVV